MGVGSFGSAEGETAGLVGLEEPDSSRTAESASEGSGVLAPGRRRNCAEEYQSLFNNLF